MGDDWPALGSDPLWQNDVDLLEGFREGRPEALALLYRTYASTVNKYVRALARAGGHNELLQAGEIADVVQEVFVRAFSATARSNYDGHRDFSPYLITIARHRVIDHLRVRAREVLKEPGELSEIAEWSSTGPETSSPFGAASAVARYLDGLPRRLRDVYHQRFVLERSQEASAAALGISRAALRGAEARLYEGLRKILRNDRAG
jgi:RNA polymerase sigma factor (sigma-70 family)